MRPAFVQTALVGNAARQGRGRLDEDMHSNGLPVRLPALLALAILAPAVLAGCYTGEGSGRLALSRHALDGFTKVTLDGAGEVIITPGAYAVSVSAEDNVLPSIRVHRAGDTLVLGREVDWVDGIRPTVPIEFRVSLPALEAVAVSGSGRVGIYGMRSRDDLTLGAYGGGVIHAAAVEVGAAVMELRGASTVIAGGLRARHLRCDIGGSAGVSVAGEVDTLDVRVASSGLYRGSSLRARVAVVRVGAAGEAFVWAEEHLGGRVGEGGRLSYRGQPVIEATAMRDTQLIALDGTAQGR